MSLTLSRLFNKKKTPTGLFGIEMELEYMEPQAWDLIPTLWTLDPHEHSLRHNGYEIKSVSPLSLQDFQPMVRELLGNINARNPIQDSPRTSVHIHLNMSKTKVLQILNCMVAYWLLETPLVRYCGEEREGHHFCLRLKDAEAVIDVLCESLENKIPLRDLGDSVRYAGLNLNALVKFGSLEFRTMRGTTDPEIIIPWAQALHHLCNVAKTYASPTHVFNRYLDCTKEAFVREFLPGQLADVVLGTPGYKESMDENASILCSLAFCQDWKVWEKAVTERVAEAYASPRMNKSVVMEQYPWNVSSTLGEVYASYSDLAILE